MSGRGGGGRGGRGRGEDRGQAWRDESFFLDSLFGCWIAIAACLKGERWPHSKFHKRDVFGVCYMLVQGVRVHVPLFVRADTRFRPARKNKQCYKKVINKSDTMNIPGLTQM